MAQTSTMTPFNFGEGDAKAAATYNKERIVFQVSSHALGFASPVWKKFLFPPFPSTMDEAAKDGINIDFTDDNGEAVLLLLNIAHLQFNKICTDKPLPYQLLLQVAILCDQYDCVQLVRPWLSQWMTNEIEEANKIGQERWLFISWVFGREDVFRRLATRLAKNVHISEQGKCCSSSGIDLSEGMPPGIMGT